jgi:hypothetical protein
MKLKNPEKRVGKNEVFRYLRDLSESLLKYKENQKELYQYLTSGLQTQKKQPSSEKSTQENKVFEEEKYANEKIKKSSSATTEEQNAQKIPNTNFNKQYDVKANILEARKNQIILEIILKANEILEQEDGQSFVFSGYQ